MSSGLRAHSWKRFIKGPDPQLLEELYVPGLREAVRYDRCCAYFSSSVLSAAALTYVAATLQAVAQLLYFVMLAMGSRR